MKKVTLLVVGAVAFSASFASAGESLFPRMRAPLFGRPAFFAQNDPALPPMQVPAPTSPTLNYQPDATPDATYPDPAIAPEGTFAEPAPQQFVDPAAPGAYPGIQPLPEWQGAPGAEFGSLYQNVEVEDPENIAPCAVPQIVQVPLKTKCGCAPQLVSVQIMVPTTCAAPRVKHSHFSNKVKYDFGRYEVEVKAEDDGIVKVDYDNSVLNLLN